MTPAHPNVRLAPAEDAPSIGRLLHDFNTEYRDPSPGPERLAERVRELIGAGETAVLLVGDGPDGLALMRFRPSLFSAAQECYLAELYVVPARRGQGLGRALMERSIELARERCADHILLGTSEDDVAARRLYESLGFTNRERPPEGPIMYVYELGL